MVASRNVDRFHFADWTVGFTVDLKLCDHAAVPGVDAKWRSNFASSHSTWNDVSFNHLYMDLQYADFNLDCSDFAGLSTANDKGSIDKAHAAVIYVRDHYLKDLASAGYHILASIPVSRAPSKHPGVLTSATFFVDAKDAPNVPFDENSLSESSVQIAGMHLGKPLPSPLPHHLGTWVTNIPTPSQGTLALSASSFLHAYLLPALSEVNARTRVEPVSQDASGVTLVRWCHHPRRVTGDCRFKPVVSPISSEEPLRFRWSMGRRFNMEKDESCFVRTETENYVDFPTTPNLDDLDIVLWGSVNLELADKGWNSKASAQWETLVKVKFEGDRLHVSTDPRPIVYSTASPHGQPQTVVAHDSTKVLLKTVLQDSVQIRGLEKAFQPLEAALKAHTADYPGCHFVDPVFNHKGDLLVQISSQPRLLGPELEKQTSRAKGLVTSFGPQDENPHEPGTQPPLSAEPLPSTWDYQPVSAEIVTQKYSLSSAGVQRQRSEEDSSKQAIPDAPAPRSQPTVAPRAVPRPTRSPPARSESPRVLDLDQAVVYPRLRPRPRAALGSGPLQPTADAPLDLNTPAGRRALRAKLNPVRATGLWMGQLDGAAGANMGAELHEGPRRLLPVPAPPAHNESPHIPDSDPSVVYLPLKPQPHTPLDSQPLQPVDDAPLDLMLPVAYPRLKPEYPSAIDNQPSEPSDGASSDLTKAEGHRALRDRMGHSEHLANLKINSEAAVCSTTASEIQKADSEGLHWPLSASSSSLYYTPLSSPTMEVSVDDPNFGAEDLPDIYTPSGLDTQSLVKPFSDLTTASLSADSSDFALFTSSQARGQLGAKEDFSALSRSPEHSKPFEENAPQTDLASFIDHEAHLPAPPLCTCGKGTVNGSGCNVFREILEAASPVGQKFSGSLPRFRGPLANSRFASPPAFDPRAHNAMHRCDPSLYVALAEEESYIDSDTTGETPVQSRIEKRLDIMSTRPRVCCPVAYTGACPAKMAQAGFLLDQLSMTNLRRWAWERNTMSTPLDAGLSGNHQSILATWPGETIF
ncbi:hypothetical protein PsYK624_129080 [Phanerochaete sordida]|uniref:Uncharacterized protein n=1 Tax=Phanerochaete sordida TaxID=48140 RepID=A0A9P3LIZ7_9APHY|nr:hypothetical protein PsYK624_129080 [Phanerochaete sordida]